MGMVGANYNVRMEVGLLLALQEEVQRRRLVALSKRRKAPALRSLTRYFTRILFVACDHAVLDVDDAMGVPGNVVFVGN